MKVLTFITDGIALCLIALAFILALPSALIMYVLNGHKMSNGYTLKTKIKFPEE